jgi:hypothetical protein
MVEASKITFSGNKGDAQIATLAMAQRWEQISYQQHSDSGRIQTIEISFDDIKHKTSN